MRANFARTIIEKLKENYTLFAEEFSQTREFAWPEFSWIKNFIQKEDKVLEIGCGNGRFLKEITDLNVDYTGIDFCTPLVAIARKRYPKATFINEDITRTTLPEKEYDVILAIAVLHHIPSGKLRSKVIKEMYKSLKDDGIIIISVWNLFRMKYLTNIAEAIIRSVVTFGRYAWNDLSIPWKKGRKKPLQRYYHAFTQGELKYLLQKNRLTITEKYTGNSNNITLACTKNMAKAVQQPIFDKEEKENLSRVTQPATSQQWQ